MLPKSAVPVMSGMYRAHIVCGLLYTAMSAAHSESVKAATFAGSPDSSSAVNTSGGSTTATLLRGAPHTARMARSTPSMVGVRPLWNCVSYTVMEGCFATSDALRNRPWHSFVSTAHANASYTANCVKCPMHMAETTTASGVSATPAHHSVLGDPFRSPRM